MADRIYKAKQLRKALEMFIQTLDKDEDIMSVADIYPVFEENKLYREGEIVSSGKNDFGDTQLYRVTKEHIITNKTKDNEASKNLEPIGVDDKGVISWTKPFGVEDAYDKGDIVIYENEKWINTVEKNTLNPKVDGWEKTK